jgi:hypothetical protein
MLCIIRRSSARGRIRRFESGMPSHAVGPVDRLTRSLADFAKLIELFETHSVSFVSVTQSFNWTYPDFVAIRRWVFLKICNQTFHLTDLSDLSFQNIVSKFSQLGQLRIGTNARVLRQFADRRTASARTKQAINPPCSRYHDTLSSSRKKQPLPESGVPLLPRLL